MHVHIATYNINSTGHYTYTNSRYNNTIMFDLRLFSESPSHKTIVIIIQRFMLGEQQYTDII